MKPLEKVIISIMVGVNLLGLFFAFYDQSFFEESYMREDGFVEYGTAVFFLVSSIIAFIYAFKLKGNKKGLFFPVTFFIGILFFFVAGEEVSWGQRMFEVKSSEFFEENNAQGETNLHNLTVNGVKINKLIFGQLLSIGILVYMLVFPILYDRKEPFKNFIDKFYIPLPQRHTVIAFVGTAMVILIIQASRKWELLELSAALSAFIIMLFPKNGFIYK
ncbi:MAG: hypothetical protein AAF363_05695 [Bacteroidota bacterium]